MAQYELQITDLERIFRKRYKIVIFCIIVSVFFSILFAKLKIPYYKTSATVKIDRNSIMGLSSEAAIYGTWDNIETQTQVIKSYPVLLLAAKKLHLVHDSVSENVNLSDEKISAKLKRFGSKISTSINSGTNIVQISVTSSDPQEAKNLANAVALSYKEFSIHGKKLHAMQTKQFIEDQLEKNQAELSEIENIIQNFEENQKIPSIKANAQRIIQEEERVDGQLRAIEDAISIIRIEEENLKEWFENNNRVSKRNLKKKSDSLYVTGNMEWVSHIADGDPGLIQLNNRLIQLQIQRDDQLSFYKLDHPTIKDIDKKIKATIGQILIKYQIKLSEMSSKQLKFLDMKQNIVKELKLIPRNEMTYARLKRRLSVIEKLNTVLSTRLQEALIAEAGVINDVTVMSLATTPTTQLNNSVSQVSGVGIFLGLVLGIIFAIMREMFDTSIGTIKDVERTLKLSVLAVIPHINPIKLEQNKKENGKETEKDVSVRGSDSILATHFNPKVPVAEAYRILRTNIDYILYNKSIKTILFTSSAMQEGKSTTISNLGVVFAQQGKKVLIVELNLRRPSLHKVLGYDRGPGITDILIGKTKWQNCIKNVIDLALGKFTIDDVLATPGLDNLYVLPYGHKPPNPTELISSNKMDELLKEFKDHFDLILVDGPPLLPVADSMIISKKVDGVILVYMVGKTPRNSLRLTKDRLETVKANVLGLVLNGIRPETGGTEYASYSMYAYTSEKEKNTSGKKSLLSKSGLFFKKS